MGFFNLFGDSEHRVFNYKPIYYNPEEDERRRKFGSVDGTLEKEKKDGTYVPGSYIKGSLRDGHYQSTREHMKKTQVIIGIISMILIVAVLYFIAKFYSLL
ncbi:MAG TPA: hypothetical protein DDX33_07425 [Rikenellaceae bacterium]|nr:hypothetical protein [Rikenellaceae bacterium]HBH21755.1 hypothetical protein [Rikenellaceae bacterium]